MRARCCICCWEPSVSCFSSPVPTSPRFCWLRPPAAPTKWRSAPPSVPAGPASSDSCLWKASCSRSWRASLAWSWPSGERRSSSRSLRRRIPRLAQAGVDGPVLTFTLLVCTVVSVLFALPPALQVSRVDANDSLQAATGRTVVGGRGRQLRDALVVAEIALTVILLTGGGLLVRSLLALQQVSLGFRPEHVLAMEATPQNRHAPRRSSQGFSPTCRCCLASSPLARSMRLQETSIRPARIGSTTFRRN